MTERLGRAPVLPQPLQRVRMIRPELQDVTRDRHQRVQIEATSLVVTHPGYRQRVPARNRIAQFAREHPRALETERARLPLGGRQSQEGILLDPVEIEMPRDDPGPRRGRPKPGHGVRRALDPQVMEQPVRMRRRDRRKRPVAGGRHLRLRPGDSAAVRRARMRRMASVPRAACSSWPHRFTFRNTGP